MVECIRSFLKESIMMDHLVTESMSEDFILLELSLGGKR